MSEFVPCPHCGGDIKADATFCRHCGSSDADGWSETWDDDDEEDDFNYEEFVQDEFSPRVTNTQTRAIWRLTAVVLIMAFAFFFYNFTISLF